MATPQQAMMTTTIWTLEGTGGQFGSQWTVDPLASSGSNSFKSNTHPSLKAICGCVSFDFKTDTCPVLTNCNDRFPTIDNTVMVRSKTVACAVHD